MEIDFPPHADGKHRDTNSAEFARRSTLAPELVEQWMFADFVSVIPWQIARLASERIKVEPANIIEPEVRVSAGNTALESGCVLGINVAIIRRNTSQMRRRLYRHKPLASRII